MPKPKAFKAIEMSLLKNYLGKKVPRKYQPRYGKRYDRRDVKSFAFAVAKSKGIKV